MHYIQFILLLTVAFACAGCTQQSELAELPQARTVNPDDLRAQATQIVIEPEYDGKPHYALLVFGENADKQTWLVVDNETIYLDRNSDGDLTADDEKIHLDAEATAKIEVGGTGEFKGMNVFDLGNIAGHDLDLQVWVRNEDYEPRTTRDIGRVRRRLENGWINATLWRANNEREGRAQIPVIFCRRPEDSQISHIDGPLTYDLKWGERQKLDRSTECIFDIHIGTPGLAPRNSQNSFFSKLSTNEVPEHIIPTAVFTFENRTEGVDSIVLTIDLDLRC